jgi:hypothetical protein
MYKIKLIFNIALNTLLLYSCNQSSNNNSSKDKINEVQSKYEIFIEESCGFDRSMINQKVYTFDSDNEAELALKKIMKLTGLPANFEIKAASVPNACAVIKCNDEGDCERFIFYNQEFMEKIKNESNTSYAELAILAHEIAHHLSGHTLKQTGNNYDMELEADKFSGFILFKLGATIEQTKSAFSTLPVSGSYTHPPKSARIAAISNGWYEAKRNGEPIIFLKETKNQKIDDNDLKQSTPESKNKIRFNIGDEYQGGIVAYLFTESEKTDLKGKYGTKYIGIIAAPFDQSEGIEWGALKTQINDIRDWFGEYDNISTTASIRANSIIKKATSEALAMNLCDNLVLNGYSDWHLPSRNALLELFKAREKIGGFVEGKDYWSSTYEDFESNWEPGLVKYSYVVKFKDESTPNLGSGCPRHLKKRVRAIRFFK